MDLLNLRNLAIAATTAMFIGLSPLGATANETHRGMSPSMEPDQSIPRPWAEMDLAPEIDWGVTLDAARDWTGLFGIPKPKNDEGADFSNVGDWLEDLIGPAGNAQETSIEEIGDL